MRNIIKLSCLSLVLGVSSFHDAYAIKGIFSSDEETTDGKVSKNDNDSKNSPEDEVFKFEEYKFHTDYSAERKKAEEYTFVPNPSNEVVRERLRKIENDIPLEFNPRIRKFIDYYTKKDRAHTKATIERANAYFPMFERVLKEYNMPPELKYLAVVESALRPAATSWVGAKGLWQFMPATGKWLGLRQNKFVDERMDPEQATIAAAKYLKNLYDTFGNWELAVSAYNSGPGWVRKAIRKSGGKKRFWDVYTHLPRETRNYLPQLIAVYYAHTYADEHNIFPSEEVAYIPTKKVYIDEKVSLPKLAKALKVDESDLDMLNPHLLKDLTPGNGDYAEVNIPENRLDFYKNNEQEIIKNALVSAPKPKEAVSKRSSRKSSSSSVATTSSNTNKKLYTVRKGDYLGKIASRNGVSVSDLKKWNGKNTNRIYPGQKLIVGYGSSNATASRSTSTSTKASTKYYTVRKGDYLGKIASKHGVSVSYLKRANNLNSNRIDVGQKLKVRG